MRRALMFLRFLLSTVAPDKRLPLIEAVIVHSRGRISNEGYKSSRSSQPA